MMKLNLSQLLTPRVWHRLAIAIGVMMIPILILGFELYQDEQERVDQALNEDLGLSYLRPLHDLMVEMAKHRDLNALQLAGYASFRRELDDQTAVVDRAIEALEVAELEYGELFDKDHIFDEIKAEWITLRDHELDISEERSLEEHNLIMDQLFEHNSHVAEDAQLNNDPDSENYYMIDMTVHKLPELLNQIANLRQQATEALERGTLTVEEELELAGDEYIVANELKFVKEDFEFAFKNDPELRSRLAPSFDSFTTRVERMLADIDEIEHEALLGEEIKVSPEQMFDDSTEALLSGAAFFHTAEPALQERLDDRLAESRTRQLTFLGSGVLAAVVAIALAWFNIRSVTSPIATLNEVAMAVASGDKDARSRLITRDELGQLGQQFDMMVDQQVATADKINEENEDLNNSIIALLQGAGALAQNDLTVKVPVAENVTGAVSDAINAMAGSAAEVLGEVSDIADDVASSSKKIENQATAVISLAQSERKIVATATNQLTTASQAMIQIAKVAARCNEVASEAIGSTEKAQGTVGSTIDGITAIRDTIRETEKRIKRLGERSQEISGVVTLINNIAERTHILALNASMHAASAGEAGRGFAVVANEVQRLAENSREATTEIASLVSNIQVETSDTVVTMNEAISRVVSGTQLAEQAGSEMNATAQTTSELVKLVQKIAADSREQAKVTESLRQNTSAIDASTKKTYENLEIQMGHTKRLVGFSGGLLRAIGAFKLPEKLVRKASSTVVEPDDVLDASLIDDGVAANA